MEIIMTADNIPDAVAQITRELRRQAQADLLRAEGMHTRVVKAQFTGRSWAFGQFAGFLDNLKIVNSAGETIREPVEVKL